MASEGDPVNPDRLTQLMRLGGPHLMLKLIGLVLEGIPIRIAAARKGAAEGRWKAVEDAAHSVRSSAGNIGAAGLQAAAGKIEALAASGETASIPALLDDLDAAFSRVRVRLEEEERRLPA